jgi:DNA-binding NarL/FixJ family response regulator
VETVVAARHQSNLKAALDFLYRAEAVSYPGALPPELAAVLRTLVQEASDRTRQPVGDLSDREREVLVCVAEGKTNAAIAAKLSIAPTTVRTHLEHIYRKLDVHSRTAALARAREISATATSTTR